ncbi:MAG: cell surface protein [Bacteroidota bacterium]
MIYRLFLFACIGLSIQACSNKKAVNQVSMTEDYDKYLTISENENFTKAKEAKDFWLSKVESNPNGHAYRVKAASNYERMYSASGNIEYLKNSEQELMIANERTGYNNPSYLQSLAYNFISQHRFKEALALLEKAENFQQGIDGTNKMLFDVHLELGNYISAKTYLDKIENFSDFDFLIRLSKWNDHKGNLDAAIKYMEKAVARAESRNLQDLKQWSYSNIADFYGHAGKIDESYRCFLKALELDPNDAYSKKGIAWIVYSHEKNPEEALRILNAITDNYNAPDYHLLKAEIAEFQNNEELMMQEMNRYHKALKNKAYGDMYNTYNVLIYADDEQQNEDAIVIAQTEVKNRPTPQSYDLLAWAYFKNGNVEKALEIAQNHVANKTFEPEALYHLAEIYKANGKIDKVAPLKEELLASVYELGPAMKFNIEKL